MNTWLDEQEALALMRRAHEATQKLDAAKAEYRAAALNLRAARSEYRDVMRSLRDALKPAHHEPQIALPLNGAAPESPTCDRATSIE